MNDIKIDGIKPLSKDELITTQGGFAGLILGIVAGAVIGAAVTVATYYVVKAIVE